MSRSYLRHFLQCFLFGFGVDMGVYAGDLRGFVSDYIAGNCVAYSGVLEEAGGCAIGESWIEY